MSAPSGRPRTASPMPPPPSCALRPLQAAGTPRCGVGRRDPVGGVRPVVLLGALRRRRRAAAARAQRRRVTPVDVVKRAINPVDPGKSCGFIGGFKQVIEGEGKGRAAHRPRADAPRLLHPGVVQVRRRRVLQDRTSPRASATRRRGTTARRSTSWRRRWPSSSPTSSSARTPRAASGWCRSPTTRRRCRRARRAWRRRWASSTPSTGFIPILGQADPGSTRWPSSPSRGRRRSHRAGLRLDEARRPTRCPRARCQARAAPAFRGRDCRAR